MTSAVSHGGITSYPNIHVPYQWTYADAAARLAATGFVPADVGKLARQLDANTLYMLTDDSPETWVLVGGPGASYTDEQAQDAIGAMVADTSSINFAYTDATPELKAEAIFGTTAGTVAEGDHTHVGGGSYTDEEAQDAVGTILVDGTGINFTYNDATPSITAEPIFAGTGSAGTVAHSDHTHGGGTTITVQEGDVDVDTGVSTLDFDGSDFNVTSSPAGEANIALAYGTSAGTPAEGNHSHANDHVAATVLDSANIDLGITGQQITADLTTAAKTFTINFIIDGGGSVITTGIKGDVMVDRACTITAWTALADVAGAIVVDIWGDSYENFPPVVGDSITTSEKPTITATNTKGQDTSLNSGSGWAISSGMILRFNVDSITTCTRVTIALKCVAA